MAEISATMVKELREKTGSGIMDCKNALKENDGNVEKALDFLRKKGLATAAKRSGRDAKEGVVQSYIHMGGKIGVIVEINCETDFVAKNDDFQIFTKNVAMHIAAAAPMGMGPEEIPAEVVEKERVIYRERALEQGKPENIVDKIVDGQIEKFYKDSCLMSQPFVKDPKVTIADLVTDTIAKMGENIVISRFTRFQIGE